MNTSAIKGNSSRTNVRKTDVVIIGAGASGLAISHELGVHGVDHIILERGTVANSWRRERWDSLKLLTPNWQTRLPGKHYTGNNPDSFMATGELIQFLNDYAITMTAPVHCGVTVTSVFATGAGYCVVTDQGRWHCRAVVIATGAFNSPVIPNVAASLPTTMQTLTAQQYKNPDQLESGGVLVVGAAATGLQLAHEIQASGRQVTLCVGEHVRMPRTYRGKDIFWWLQHSGVAGESLEKVDDVARVRSLPSPQLLGSHQHSIFDLNTLQDGGVRLAGRFMNANAGALQFSGALHNVCQLADLKMQRLFSRFDQWLQERGVDREFPEPENFKATQVTENPLLQLPVRSIRTIIWATGFKPDYSWLQLPVLNRKGMLMHQGGVVNAPGVYVLGLPALRRRNSSFISGIAEDACELAVHLTQYLNTVGLRQMHATG